MDQARRDAWLEEAERRTRGAGHRGGAVRSAVLRLLASEGCLLTAEQITERLAQGDVGSRASVYRVLDRLGELGLVRRLDDVSEVSRYEIVDDDHHHHHIVDEDSGEIIAFTDPVLEASIEAIGARLGITLTGHDVVLRGTKLQTTAKRRAGHRH